MNNNHTKRANMLFWLTTVTNIIAIMAVLNFILQDTPTSKMVASILLLAPATSFILQAAYAWRHALYTCFKVRACLLFGGEFIALSLAFFVAVPHGMLVGFLIGIGILFLVAGIGCTRQDNKPPGNELSIGPMKE